MVFVFWFLCSKKTCTPLPTHSFSMAWYFSFFFIGFYLRLFYLNHIFVPIFRLSLLLWCLSVTILARILYFLPVAFLWRKCMCLFLSHQIYIQLCNKRCCFNSWFVFFSFVHSLLSKLSLKWYYLVLYIILCCFIFTAFGLIYSDHYGNVSTC